MKTYKSYFVHFTLNQADALDLDLDLNNIDSIKILNYNTLSADINKLFESFGFKYTKLDRLNITKYFYNNITNQELDLIKKKYKKDYDLYYHIFPQ